MTKLLKKGRVLLWATMLLGIATAPIAHAGDSVACVACGVCVATTGPEDPICWYLCYKCFSG